MRRRKAAMIPAMALTLSGALLAVGAAVPAQAAGTGPPPPRPPPSSGSRPIRRPRSRSA
ncbi:hypothetical protein [Kitasatospora albolonga]|uniref:hypothetical protein n=1 Tax=Kitasatospora albolonga TaxID=68173 RepID=UPI001FCA007E